MSDEKKDDLISVYIDDREVRVPAGTNMVDAAASAGIEVPHYCYHPHLSVVGNCRMCLVELGMPGKDRQTGEPMLNEDGSPKIMWIPKPAIACSTKASPGMHMKTKSDVVKQCREGVMEFLLVNHPLDCPICDQAGECRLQEFATDYGRGFSRFVERKNVKPKRTLLGPRVMLDDERCILCSRCIRFSKEIANDDVLGFIDRGSYSTLTCFPGKELENNYSLNTVDICPVGALTNTDFRFKMRVWFLKEAPSICTESSVGVNTTVASREGQIYRVTPRRNDEVNDSWMSDSGRALYKLVEQDDRLGGYTIGGKPVKVEEAVSKAVELIKEGPAAFVGSGHNSVEEQWLFKMIAEAVPGSSTDLVAHLEEGDGLLISTDRTPNTRGALLTGFINELPKENLFDLGARIDAGEVKTLVVYNEDVTKAGISVEQLKKINVVYLGTHHCDSCQYATVEIPTLMVFEKKGTFVNQQFRVQKFMPAVYGPQGVRDDIDVLRRMLARLIDHDYVVPTPEEVWRLMSRNVKPFEGLTFEQIPDTGTLVDGSAFDHLPFPEGKTLHYEPKQEPAAAGA